MESPNLFLFAQVKRCRKCGKVKLIGEFYVNLANADGRFNACMDCTRTYEAGRRAINMKDPIWLAAERKRWAKAGKASTAKHINKDKARRIARRALRNNELTKPARCERCEACTKDLQMHHADYDKPLDVVWVCAACHGYLNRKFREPDAFDVPIQRNTISAEDAAICP